MCLFRQRGLDDFPAMTNLLFTIALVLSTNWTGYINGTNELGYVLTNHVATVVYRGRTNEFTLLSEPSGTAVWRPQQATIWNSGSLTNYSTIPMWTPRSYLWYDRGIELTNCHRDALGQPTK